ncbi:MAG: hypothetical protein P8N76_21925 [Pirellulaceae bacterium]|nr:hypothetical protein [Pirellulaceae bacterium]
MTWVHLHLALNHIPVLGTLFVGILFVIAFAKRSPELTRLSLIAFVTLTVISIPIKFTGDFAYESMAEADWMPADIAQAHEQAADQATSAIFLLGLASMLGLYLGRGSRRLPVWSLVVTSVLTVITFVLMARAANLGGQLRHEEIRPVTIREKRLGLDWQPFVS